MKTFSKLGEKFYKSTSFRSVWFGFAFCGTMIVNSSASVFSCGGNKGGVRITNHGNKMLNFTFHVKEIQHFHVSREKDMAKMAKRVPFLEIPFTTLSCVASKASGKERSSPVLFYLLTICHMLWSYVCFVYILKFAF